jgi:membrane-associated progesterone receptor component
MNIGVDGGLCYVAIKGQVFDVTGNKAYQPGGSYHGSFYHIFIVPHPLRKPIWHCMHIRNNKISSQLLILAYTVFAGHDASRALGKTSTKAEDVSPEWADLPDSEKKVLDDWFTFFSKRYNIVGVVEGATNL